MQIYVYPHYVGKNVHFVLAQYSPQFNALLKELGVELEVCQWYGTASSIPEGEPCIVRASSRQIDSWKTIGERCASLGHLCFYEDNWVSPDGFEFMGWIHFCLRQSELFPVTESRAEWFAQHQDATILLEKSRAFFRNLGYTC